MKHRKFTEQQEKDIEEIVEFYLRYVTDFKNEFAEHLEYFWRCMSDGSIEDYAEIVRERKKESK